jgi:hypothetical protein
MASTPSTSRGKVLKMKKVVITKAIMPAMIVLSLLAGGCSSSSQQTKSASVAKPPIQATASATINTGDKPLRTAIVYSDYAVAYTNVSQLAQNANLIVRGKVTKVEYVEFNTVQYTKVSLQVTKSFSPGAKPGDTITVLDDGGITTLAQMKRETGRPLEAPITAADENTKVQVLSDGEPLAKVGDEVVYFLSDEGQLGVLPGKYYDTLGAYQGKFNVKNGVAQRHTREADPTRANSERLSMTESALNASIMSAPKKRSAP